MNKYIFEVAKNSLYGEIEINAVNEEIARDILFSNLEEGLYERSVEEYYEVELLDSEEANYTTMQEVQSQNDWADYAGQLHQSEQLDSAYTPMSSVQQPAQTQTPGYTPMAVAQQAPASVTLYSVNTDLEVLSKLNNLLIELLSQIQGSNKR